MNAILHPKHQIQWLGDAMDGSFFENALGFFYSPKGRPVHPIGVMVGCWM
ncbi:MAG: hypothetical protein OXC64_00200 [Flavobacteriaceae bacterium]|nr:hypothetical protein [Flavobacteriaceae bacterium]